MSISNSVNNVANIKSINQQNKEKSKNKKSLIEKEFKKFYKFKMKIVDCYINIISLNVENKFENYWCKDLSDIVCRYSMPYFRYKPEAINELAKRKNYTEEKKIKYSYNIFSKKTNGIKFESIYYIDLYNKYYRFIDLDIRSILFLFFEMITKDMKFSMPNENFRGIFLKKLFTYLEKNIVSLRNSLGVISFFDLSSKNYYENPSHMKLYSSKDGKTESIVLSQFTNVLLPLDERSNQNLSRVNLIIYNNMANTLLQPGPMLVFRVDQCKKWNESGNSHIYSITFRSFYESYSNSSYGANPHDPNCDCSDSEYDCETLESFKREHPDPSYHDIPARYEEDSYIEISIDTNNEGNSIIKKISPQAYKCIKNKTCDCFNYSKNIVNDPFLRIEFERNNSREYTENKNCYMEKYKLGRTTVRMRPPLQEPKYCEFSMSDYRDFSNIKCSDIKFREIEYNTFLNLLGVKDMKKFHICTPLSLINNDTNQINEDLNKNKINASVQSINSSNKNNYINIHSQIANSNNENIINNSSSNSSRKRNLSQSQSNNERNEVDPGSKRPRINK